MKRNWLIATLLLLALALAAPLARSAEAGKPPVLEDNLSYGGFVATSLDGDTASFSLQVRASVWTLMGEPVVYCTATWKFQSAEIVDVDGKTVLISTHDIGSNALSKTVSDVEKAIELYDVVVDLPIPLNKVNAAHISCDPCVLFSSGSSRPSYNVPGSPNWERLMDWGTIGNWLSAQEAKKILSDPNARFDLAWRQPRYSGIRQFRINLNSLKRWHAQKQRSQVEAELAQAAKQTKPGKPNAREAALQEKLAKLDEYGHHP